jgi:hypothetical protein
MTTRTNIGVRLPADREPRGLALASLIIGMVCVGGSATCALIDFVLDGAATWSVIVAVSALLGWILIGFPMACYRRPGIFLPVMAAAIFAYLRGLEQLTGGDWFLPLALPIYIASLASAALAAFLSIRARRRGPNIGAFVLFGGTLACLAIENILSLSRRGAWSFTWSAIVAVSALSVALLLLGIQSRLRQAR